MQASSSLMEGGGPLVSDLEVVTRLYRLGLRCARAGNDFNGCLEAILDAALYVTAADQGTIQLLERHSGELAMVVQRGFGRSFLEFFAHVHEASAVVCGAALGTGQRVVVEDLTHSELFARQSSVASLLAEGVRALQSTPLLSSSGRVFGMISTYCKRPGRLDERRLRYLDLLARQAADYFERRESERLLVAKEVQLEHIATHAGVLISQCSRDQRYLFVNKLCAEFLGLPAERIVGRKLIEVVGEAAHQVIQPYIERVLRGERVEYEAEIPYAAAGLRYVHATYVPDVDPDGSICGWIGTITDVTEQRRLAERIQVADRHKDEFLAVLAHELRNPLAPIRLGVDVLLRGAADEKTRSTLQMLERQVSHLVRLVDDLLDVSRVNLEKIELKKERTALGDVVREAIQNHQTLIHSKRHSLSLAVPDQPIHILADPVRLAQAVGNLIHNACKYTEEGGSIAITVDHDASEARVGVRDNGIGIAVDDMPRIFELFTQLDRSPQRSRGGLGIGLTLVRSVVERHDGTMEVRSEGPGRGSEFVIHLPKAADSVAARAAEAEHTSSPGRRIMIVDDNRDAADSLAALLQLHGHAVQVFYDAAEAESAAERMRPEVVLLDIAMPGIDGYELCRRMRPQAWGREALLIAVTGYGQQADVVNARAAGFDHHLTKPLEYQSLNRLLGALPAPHSADDVAA